MVVIAARSSDLGMVEESNGRNNKIMRLTSYRNAKIQEQEKIRNNCERKNREIHLEWTWSMKTYDMLPKAKMKSYKYRPHG